MKTLYLVWFISLFFSGLSLPTQEDLIDIHVQQPVGINYKFDPENITVRTSTNWKTGINISTISSDDNKHNYLSTYYNISDYFTLPDETRPSHMMSYENVNNVSLYESHDYSTEGVQYKTFVSKDGILEILSIQVSETVSRSVNFSDLINRNSIIEYKVDIRSIVTITFPTNMSNYTTYQNLEQKSDKSRTLASSTVAAEPSILLANATGIYTSTCIKNECSTNTKYSSDEKINYSKDVQFEVYKETIYNATSYDSESYGNTTYTKLSHVDTYYRITIAHCARSSASTPMVLYRLLAAAFLVTIQKRIGWYIF